MLHLISLRLVGDEWNYIFLHIFGAVLWRFNRLS